MTEHGTNDQTIIKKFDRDSKCFDRKNRTTDRICKSMDRDRNGPDNNTKIRQGQKMFENDRKNRTIVRMTRQ